MIKQIKGNSGEGKDVGLRGGRENGLFCFDCTAQIELSENRSSWDKRRVSARLASRLCIQAQQVPAGTCLRTAKVTGIYMQKVLRRHK